MQKPELMAPAGDWMMLKAALRNGADAVYFGIDKLNMRAKAKNFTIDDLQKISRLCKRANAKTYLTLNTLVYEDDLNQLDEILIAAKNAEINMIICWDFAVIEKCREHKVDFCISTQGSIANSASVKFFESIGTKRIVLARECSLEEIKKISSTTSIEIETFIHGAMCIAVSGRCFMSHELFGLSANDGECIQPCRREYEIYDKASDKSLLLGEDYVMSAKDLCTIEFIDKLIEAGIDSFKIEGRKRSPEYTAKVVLTYRKAIDYFFDGKLTKEVKAELKNELEKVYNRGFSNGFYLGKPDGNDFAVAEGSIATTRKEYIGKVLNYYNKSKIAHIKIESGSFSIDDNLLIMGNTTGLVELQVKNIRKDEIPIEDAIKNDLITIECEKLVRRNDRVYVVKKVDN